MPLRKNLKIRYEIKFGSNSDCNEKTLVVQATYKVIAGNSGHPKLRTLGISQQWISLFWLENFGA